MAPPNVGADVMTPAPVRYETRIGDEAKRVVIRLPEGERLVLSIAGDGEY